VLSEFLKTHRETLIANSRAKVSSRPAPRATSMELKTAVPLFLDQLIATLQIEESTKARHSDQQIGLSAAKHGKALQKLGFTAAQVIHDYGDVCQAITELAKEKQVLLTLDEFGTLSRLLDNAMADAVAAFDRHRELAKACGARDVGERMAARTREQRRLLDAALRAFDAHDLGDISLTGATQSVLEDSLRKLRDLQDLPLPERLAGPLPAA